MARPKTLAGTARLLHELKENRDVAKADGTEVANGLTSQSMTRRGSTDQEPVDIGTTMHITTEMMRGKSDIRDEQAIQEATSKVTIGGILEQIKTNTFPFQPEIDDDAVDHDEEEEEEDEEEEEGVGVEAWGYEDREDNEEAAYDDILKLNGM